MLNSGKNAVRFFILTAFLLVSVVGFSQASISGRCADKNGVFLKGVQVTTIQFDDKHTTETNSDGYYEDKQLSPGDWMVIYQYHDQKIVKKVTVKDSQTHVEMNIVFTIDDSGKR